MDWETQVGGQVFLKTWAAPEGLPIARRPSAAHSFRPTDGYGEIGVWAPGDRQPTRLFYKFQLTRAGMAYLGGFAYMSLTGAAALA